MKSRPSREEMQHEALTRAASGQSLANWSAIFEGFMAKGIAMDDIRPRENVFTYHAWRALGRQVRRGEHGVKVVTFVPMDAPAAGETQPDGDAPKRTGGSRPRAATVFHVTQTDPVK